MRPSNSLPVGFAAVALAAWLATMNAASAQDSTRTYRIAEQSLDHALREFALASNLDLLFSPDLVAGKKSASIDGQFTIDEGLRMLLRGSGLEFSVSGSRVVITEAKPVTSRQATSSALRGTNGYTRLAQAESGPPQSSVPQLSAQSSRASAEDRVESATIEEITVTAQKRTERLIDVPASVTAVNGARLEELRVESLSDLASFVPGLSILSQGAPGARQVVIRGIATDFNPGNAPTTATYIDDMPVGAAAPAARAPTLGLDLMPYDLASIEVLKGPQGTLYGANTLGGLVKYTLKQPSLSEIEARVGSDSESVTESGSFGWSARASLSVPIIADKLAVRTSGFYNDRPGYIDQIGPIYSGEVVPSVLERIPDANSSVQKGLMAMLLWVPIDNLRIRATAIGQDVHADNVSEIGLTNLGLTMGDSPFGRYAFQRSFPSRFDQSVRVYNINASWDFGLATLTSSTGWTRLETATQIDISGVFGGFCRPATRVPNSVGDKTPFQSPGCADYPFADAKARFDSRVPVKQFVQELRVESSGATRLGWLGGLYYSTDQFKQFEDMPAFTAALEPLSARNDIYFARNSERDWLEFTQKAAFANATFDVVDQLQIGAGVRYSDYTLERPPVFGGGIFWGNASNPVPSFANPNINSPASKLSGVNVVNWSATVRYQPLENLSLYTRAATGYRPGSGCPECGIPSLGVPGIVKPDKTTNYEVGVKGLVLDRLLVDVSAYHIDWTDVQITSITSAGTRFTGNGGEAQSEGFEAASELKLTDSFALIGSLAYTDAILTEDAPGIGGVKGERLPGSAKWTGSLTADFKQPLSHDRALILGANYRYRSSAKSRIAQAPYTPPATSVPVNAYTIDAYSLVDVHAGIEFGNVTLRGYVKNILNEEAYAGLLYVANAARPSFVPITPRMFGVSLDVTF
jgi:iron complex outermembrane recepter protein